MYIKEKKYSDIVKSLLKNQYYFIGLVIVAVATYGFSISHFSMGIDDFGVLHYMDISPSSHGNLLQQGRLLHLVFYYILGGVADVIPFLNNFLGSICMVISAILFSALIQKVTDERFTTTQMLLFSAIYISYSVISFKFIYDIDVFVTMQSYIWSVLGIHYGMKSFEKEETIKSFVISVFCIVMSIGSYEVFITVFICEVLFLLILKYLFMDFEVKSVISEGLSLAKNLIVAVVVYYAFVKVLQLITGNYVYKRETFHSIKQSLGEIYWKVLRSDLFFAKEFLLMGIFFFFLMLFFAIKKKYLVFLLFPSLVFFTFFVQFVQGYVYYRTCLTFNVFVAAVALLLMEVCRKKGKCLIVFFLSILILGQLKDMNLWFYKDWVNYQKNVWAIHTIATDLQKDYDVVNKPVCFVNRDYESFLMTWDDKQKEIGEAPLIAAVRFLGEPTSRSVIELFKYQGYNFIIEPTVEQMEKAQEQSKTMNSYPKEGYIQELPDCIIVNIGKCD